MAEHAIGVVGLATMGMNLARNLASHGASIAVYNRTRRRTDEFMSAFAGEGDFHPAFTLEELTKALRPPRAILIMVKAGAPVDEAIDALSLILKPGDTLIDGGNSLLHDTRRRAAAAAQRGLGFLGMGVSGGEEGALHGPSLMPGGPRESYDRVEEMLKAISAKVDGVTASSILTGPTRGNVTASERSSLVDDMREALYAAKIVAYAQGFEHLAAGSKEYQWTIDLGSLATIWRGGCIIRAKFLNRIRDAYAEQTELANLMLAPFFKEALESSQEAWRRVVKHAVDAGVPIPAFASSLAYYDGYRRARGPANLIQGLRDYFGSHTYRRTDREGAYHTRWAQDGAEVRTDQT